MIARNNEQIWRIAEWLWDNCNYDDACSSYSLRDDTKPGSRLAYLQKVFYDKALELLKKMANNEFTGPDNHED